MLGGDRKGHVWDRPVCNELSEGRAGGGGVVCEVRDLWRACQSGMEGMSEGRDFEGAALWSCHFWTYSQQ